MITWGLTSVNEKKELRFGKSSQPYTGSLVFHSCLINRYEKLCSPKGELYEWRLLPKVNRPQQLINYVQNAICNHSQESNLGHTEDFSWSGLTLCK